jgi:DNA-binding NarL/FixJ family response regulator
MVSKSQRQSVILADDHVMFRQDLKIMLQEKDGLEVIKEASDGLELLDILKTATPDMVIIDISMPKMNGFEAIYEIKNKYHDIQVLVLTVHREKEYLHKAITMGVNGFVLKDTVGKELFSAIETIQKGKVYIPLCHRNKQFNQNE